MSNDVDIKFAADSKSVQRSLDMMQGKLDRTQRRLEKMSVVSRQAARHTSRSFNQGTQSITSMGAKVTGVIGSLMAFKGVVRAIGDEFEATAKKQEAARVATLAPAQSLRMAKLNFNPDQTMGTKDFDPAVLALAKSESAPVEVVATALSDALSAKGSATNKQVFEAVRQALKVAPEDAGFAKTLAGGFLDIAKFSGVKDISHIPGMLLQTQSASRVTDPGKVGENLLPGIAGLVAKGDTPEQAAELVSALTQLGIEKKGETTSTAAISLGGQLMDFVPKRATKGKFKGQLVGKDSQGEFGIPDSQFSQFDAAKSPTDRIKVLHQSPELQRAFISGSSFEKKMEEPIRQMIRGTQKAQKEWQTSQNLIQAPGPHQAKVFREKIAFADSGELIDSLKADQELKARTEAHQLGDTPTQRFAFARKTVEETLSKIDRPGWDKPLNEAQLMSLDLVFKQQAAKLAGDGYASGQVIGPPELAAARTLEFVNTEGGTLLGDSMSESDKEFLKEAIESLKKRGKQRGNIYPGNQLEEHENLMEVRERLGVPKNFTGPTFDPAAQANAGRNVGNQTKDPQVEETNAILNKISDKLDAPRPPRQTERRSARLSRGAN